MLNGNPAQDKLMQSVNPTNGEVFEIPELLDDSQAIADFLATHKGKPVVVVQGLGFVGAVMAIVCAASTKADYAVIGVDLPTVSAYWRVASINAGTLPILANDADLDELFNQVMERGNLFATYDPSVYELADTIVVDINLDVIKTKDEAGNLEDFSAVIEPFHKAIEMIGDRCKQNVHVIVETTVPPGTCEKIVGPVIADALEKRGLPTDEFSVGHSYERVMPGPEYLQSLTATPRVYSGLTEKAADLTRSFLSSVLNHEATDLTYMHSTTASEMAKVLENSYRAMNIAFISEWSDFAETAGVDLNAVISAIRDRPTHKNIMAPGLGVGGYCLTKDPLLASWASATHFNSGPRLRQSERAVSINDRMPLTSFGIIEKLLGNVAGKQIAVVGVTYRGDVADTRYSPVQLLVETLQEKGARFAIYDPLAEIWPEIDRPVEQDFERIIASNPDLLVLSAGHKSFNEPKFTAQLMSMQSTIIFDSVNCLSTEQRTELMCLHRVKTIGDGRPVA